MSYFRRSRFALPTCCFLLAGLLVLGGCEEEGDASQSDAARLPVDTAETDVPYVSTPQEVVNRMLEIADVHVNDTVYDLGSGDGRIVITAAQRYRAQGVGIDIDPVRIQEARDNAEEAGVTDRVEFRQGDLFEADFSDATVVTLYLLPNVNLEVRSILFEQLDPGDRVVSHNFDMGNWEPDSTEGVGASMIHLWTIPEEIPDSLRRE